MQLLQWVYSAWLGGELRSRQRQPGFESCAVVLNLCKFVHSILLQFIRMYEWAPDYRQVLRKLGTNSVHALIAAWLDVPQRSSDGVW